MKSKKSLRDESILNYDNYEDQHGAVVPPLYQNSLFTFKGWDDIDKAFDHKTEAYIYSRLMNPTVKVAEEKIAAICRGEKAKLCASGIAAVTSAILHCVRAGDHIITIKNIYGPTNRFISSYLKEKFDISSTYVDGRDVAEFESAIKENTTLIYLESPASLTMELQDIEAITTLARAKNIKTVIDNTWASPIYQKPLTMGVDLEVHSASKYLGGHSDVVAGVIVGSQSIVDAIITAEHELLGAKMAPFEGWLILRSLRTLSIRMRALMENTTAVAEFLESDSRVVKVNYPGLKSFEQYELGQKQMTGYGCLLSFELATKEIPMIKNFIETLELFSLGVSWGGHDSLVYAPVISYLKELTFDKFEAMGINASLIRISVGLEHKEDLIDDLRNALGQIG
jgi:cystathionine beta-lyase/cystathionine gamma-synthase